MGTTAGDTPSMHAGSGALLGSAWEAHTLLHIYLRSPLIFNFAIIYNASDDAGNALSQKELTSIQTFALSLLYSYKTQRGHIWLPPWHPRHKETQATSVFPPLGGQKDLGGLGKVFTELPLAIRVVSFVDGKLKFWVQDLLCA